MKRIFSLFTSNKIASDHAADRVIDVLETMTFKEWLFCTVTSGTVMITIPLLILLFDARGAWMA